MLSLNHNFNLGAWDDSNGFMQLQDLEERAQKLRKKLTWTLWSVVWRLFVWVLEVETGLYSGCGGVSSLGDS